MRPGPTWWHRFHDAARHETRQRVASVVMATAAATAVCFAATVGAAPSRASRPSVTSASPAMQATVTSSPISRAGSWLVDGSGRVVVFHGFDIVRKTAPWYPAAFSAQDARFLRSEGFNVARIGLAWSGVEPRPGVYDDAYIGRFVAFEHLLAAYGIRAVVDFHQDMWSTQNMPSWASLGATYSDDFQHFWDNDPAADHIGIQTHYIKAWQHVAGFFAGDNNVVAYDPFNEPQPGYRSGCGPFAQCRWFESGELSAFYAKFVSAIRGAHDRHVVLLEPVADNNFTAPALTLPTKRNVGTTFHEYCNITQTATSSGPQDAACQPIDQRGLDTQTNYARETLGVPTFVGEFSSNDADDDNAYMADLMQSRFLSWTMWMYYTASSDPANTPGQGLLLDDAKPGSEANAKQGKLNAVALPYATAIAGTPVNTSYDRSTHTYTLRYSTAAVPGAVLTSRVTTVFLPSRAFPAAIKVACRHASCSRSGHVLTVRSRPGFEYVDVTVTR